MDERDELRLNPAIRMGRDVMRQNLGFRRETRMDEVITSDGTVFKELPSGVFVVVRRGPHFYEQHVRWMP